MPKAVKLRAEEQFAATQKKDKQALKEKEKRGRRWRTTWRACGPSA